MLKRHFKIWAILATVVAVALLALLITLGFLYIRSPRDEGRSVEVSSQPSTEQERSTTTAKGSQEDFCCPILYADLEQAPEGVWSNASALLLAEGWCVVIQRDQSWQQVRDEVELRKTWQEGATEDYLLLCNKGPGGRFFSLQDEFGGRPRDWWNDQAKKVWAFCLYENTPHNNVVAVLYEHDDGREGWQYAITLDMTLTRKEGKGAITTGDIAIVDTGESEEILPTATQTMPTATPVATSVPEGLPTAQAAPQCLFVGETLVSSDKIRVETNESDNFYDTSVIEVVKGQVEVVFENWDGGTRNWSETVTLGPGTYNLESVESGRYNDRLQRICASSPAKVVLFQHHDRTGKTATVVIFQ